MLPRNLYRPFVIQTNLAQIPTPPMTHNQLPRPGYAAQEGVDGSKRSGAAHAKMFPSSDRTWKLLQKHLGSKKLFMNHQIKHSCLEGTHFTSKACFPVHNYFQSISKSYRNAIREKNTRVIQPAHIIARAWQHPSHFYALISNGPLQLSQVNILPGSFYLIFACLLYPNLFSKLNICTFSKLLKATCIVLGKPLCLKFFFICMTNWTGK